METNKNYVIVGGGTAGWLTALFVKDVFPTSNVTLIQSKQIGIVGVGEATTPHIISFLISLKIDPADVIKKAGGTIKNGISFENWNGDNKRYFHSFSDKVARFAIPSVLPNMDCSEYYLKKLIKDKLPLDSYVYQTKLSYENKVDLNYTIWALHFDTNKFSDFLQSVGKQRNINTIEGIYDSVSYNDKGYINKIILKDGTNVNCDFVFDCSGFSRLLIEKELKESWIPYSEYLPMKKGMPFWLEREEEQIQPYTSAIAMPHGWMWKIPLQHRYGSGYIFDSDYIDEDRAVDEVQSILKRKIKVNKIIPFSAGRFKNAWNKNCIAIGLASSFIEPLESTSIYMSTIQLDTLRHFINVMHTPDKNSISLFNEIVGNNIDNCMFFVWLHYQTKRNDSKFWKEFKQKNSIPPAFKKQFNLLKSGYIRFFDVNSFKITGNFGMNSFLQIADGLQLFDRDINITGFEDIFPSVEKYKSVIDSLSNNAKLHHEMLNQLTSTC